MRYTPYPAANTTYGGLFRGKCCLSAKFWLVEAEEAEARCNPHDIREKVGETIDKRWRNERQLRAKDRVIGTPAAPPKRPYRAVLKRY